MPPAVITGASGFVGRRLAGMLPAATALPMTGEGWQTRLAAARLGGAVVFHLAARVHRMEDGDEAAFQRDNVEKSVALAEAARRAGARALIFASTVKVLGEESSAPLRTDAPYAPRDAYARSKRTAEEALREACAGALSLTIVRFPLVYGAGAGGNLARLRRVCDSALPLPFGAVHNRRSWIHVQDLADLLVRCGDSSIDGPPRVVHAAHPQAASTPQLVAALRLALGRAPRLLPVPVTLLEAGAAIAGSGHAMRRLTRSLELDVGETVARFQWQPRFDLARAVADLAERGA